MQITVNGKPKEIKDGGSLGELLNHLQIRRERIAVEVNLNIVPKVEYDSRTLAAGDAVEIVQFVGGG